MKAKNVHTRPINVESGRIDPGKIGEITAAEYSNFFKLFEKVEAPKTVAPAAKPAAK